MADELKIVRDWLLKLPDLDLEDIVADGGVTSGMVVQQEAALMARKLSAILARAQGPGPGEAVAITDDMEEAFDEAFHREVKAQREMCERRGIKFGLASGPFIKAFCAVLAATPTRESGNQGSSQGCGTGHSGEQLEPAVGATAALASVPCGGCGATENSKRCMGCLHDFGTPDSAWVHRYAAHPQKGGEG